MITVIIFYLHTIFAMYVFGKSYQSDGLMQAVLNLAFIIILFTVGWTVSDFFTGLIISDAGYEINLPINALIHGLLKLTGFYKPISYDVIKIIPKDTISLILASVVEYYFYKFFFGLSKQSKLEEAK